MYITTARRTPRSIGPAVMRAPDETPAVIACRDDALAAFEAVGRGV